MGKGTIVSGGTDGLYTVDFDYGSARADQLIAYFEAVIQEIETAIIEAETNRDEAAIAVSVSLQALNVAIIALNAANTKSNKEAVQTVTEVAAKNLEQRDKATARLSTLKYQLMSVKSRLASLEKIDTSDRDQVWCVDLTEDGSGEVATIEVNGEGPLKLVAPGCRAPETTDGDMTARGVQSPEQLFLNMAIIPGWQKFSPTYRTGVISNIDYENDTGDVALDTARSSAQSLGINQSTSLTAVPIEYMQCNATAFDDGDEVVVQFVGQSWDNPKVIGFVSNPKSCGPAELAFIVDIDGFTRDVDGSVGGRLGEFASSTTTNPSPGLAVIEDVYEATDQGAFVFIDEEQQFRRRLRFDYAFRRAKLSDSYFETNEVLGYTEQTHGLYYHMDCIASPNVRVVGGNAGVTTSTQNLTLETFLDEFNIEREVYAGTIVEQEYNFTSINVVTPTDYIDCDPDHATGWMASYYSAPAEVTIIIEEKPIDYVLKTFGPPPQLASVDRTYSIPRTPGGGGLINDEKIYNLGCAIYRRKNIA